MKIRTMILVCLALTAALTASAQMKGTRTVLDTGTTGTTIMSSGGAVDPCAGITLTNRFPTDKSSAKATCFWQQNGLNVLKQAQLVSSDGSVAANPEVMSDFFYGWRIAFSMAVASEPSNGDSAADEQDAEETAATNLLQANGGNLALSAQYPLYLKQNNNADNGSSGFLAATYVRLGAISDAFGDTASGSESLDWGQFSANAEWALTTQTKVMSKNDVFNLEVYTNAAVIAGTKSFRTAVGIDPGDSGIFLHGEVGANVKIGKSMMIGASWNYYSADGLDGGATVTLGLTNP